MTPRQPSISIRKSFSGRNLFFVGASGFLGKVWLSMALHRFPEIEKIYVLMRRRRTKLPQDRFNEMIDSSYVFEPLHRKHGKKLHKYLASKVEVVEGDVTKPDLGLSPEVAEHLRKNVDLLINCAGLVEFNPDIREALSVNIEGSLHCTDFVESCDDAALLHISTCFVAGTRDGRIPETLDPKKSPLGKPFDVDIELAGLRRSIDRIISDHQPVEGEERSTAILRRRHVREAMIAEGVRRAKRWGWQNAYTYTKGISEALLAQRSSSLRWSTFRPAIVESAISFPFPGWNEGFNTCGPLAYLLGTWFRYLPAKTGNPFDIVPVDTVCNGIMAISAALIEGRHAQVYQCGTSGDNLLTIDRAARLTSLSHRLHYREHGKTIMERLVRSRWNSVTVQETHPLSVYSLRTVFRDLNQLLKEVSHSPRAPRPIRAAGKRFSKFSQKTDRKLERITNLLDLFMPFIHDHHHVFETRNLKKIPLVEKEFSFAPEKMSWRDYWLDIHMPGLRRWCFPVIERRSVETLQKKTSSTPPSPKQTPQLEAGA